MKKVGRPKSNIRVQIEEILGRPGRVVFNDARKGGRRRLKFYAIEATEDQLKAIKKLPYVLDAKNWVPSGGYVNPRYGVYGWEGLVVFITTKCNLT